MLMEDGNGGLYGKKNDKILSMFNCCCIIHICINFWNGMYNFRSQSKSILYY